MRPPRNRALLHIYRTCPVQTYGRARTNLGRAAGRDLLIAVRSDQEARARTAEARPRVSPPEREFFIDNLLVRIHYIIVMMKWTGLSPREFEFLFPGSLISTFLVMGRGVSPPDPLCPSGLECSRHRPFRGLGGTG